MAGRGQRMKIACSGRLEVGGGLLEPWIRVATGYDLIILCREALPMTMSSRKRRSYTIE